MISFHEQSHQVRVSNRFATNFVLAIWCLHFFFLLIFFFSYINPSDWWQMAQENKRRIQTHA